jgi:hypothetical protein
VKETRGRLWKRVTRLTAVLTATEVNERELRNCRMAGMTDETDSAKLP